MAGVASKPQPNGKYRGWYMDANGKQRFFAGTTSEAETRRIAARLEDDERQIRLGYRPAPSAAQKHRAKPFSETKQEYLAWGRSQGGRGGRPWAKTHAEQREKKLEFWGKELGLRTLADLDGILPQVEKALQALQAKKLAGKTLTNYVEALRALCVWCVDRKYLAQNPLEGMVAFDTTPQTTRRALTPKEIGQILAKCAPHRRLTYEVAFCSGLRKNELRSLEAKHLDTRRKGLILDGAWTKNRRDGFMPLPADLVERLAAFAKTGEARSLYDRFTRRKDSTLEMPKQPLLYVPRNAARDLYKDMEAAGVSPKTPEGHADFHACRVAYVTMLLEAGTDPKTVQTLARHASAHLTMNVYAKARPERVSEAAEAVGEMVKSEPNHAVSMHKQAAGAEGVDVSAVDHMHIQRSEGQTVRGFEPRTLHPSSHAGNIEPDVNASGSFRVQGLACSDI